MFVEKMWCILLSALLATAARALAATCADGESTTFEKYIGFRPERGEPVFIYAARPNEPSLSYACVQRCSDTESCSSVAVAHDAGECIGYAPAPSTTLKQDNDASFFVKICLRLPQECVGRRWAVESTPGYQLHSEGRKVQVILNVTSLECSRVLTDPGHRNEYRSAQWVSGGSAEDLHPIAGDTATVGDGEFGDCVLNAEDKYTEPESYRVANFRTVYKESQCRHDFPAKMERCSYEEYYNQSLKHVELAVKGLSADECKSSCEREERFICRGFSWSEDTGGGIAGKTGDGGGGGGLGLCSLHSEDILTFGSWLLRRAPATIYYRRVVCLNISVECTERDMVVTYRPRGTFRGRLYVPARGERCGTDAGRAAGAVTLTLPLRGPCDVNFAYAVSKGPNGPRNKTMAYAMVMVQNNPIIQTAGDRWVRVGCAPAAYAQHAHTLQAALAVAVDAIKASRVTGSGAERGEVVSEAGAVPASAVFNVSGAPSAPLTMYVVREGGGGAGAGGAVSLGELLEMRIETTDTKEMEAYHLVASSRLGDSSVLLLDQRGCPSGQVDFPPFTRSWVGVGAAGSLQRLTARFKAFRFPNSHVVRFALMVRFCSPRCAQVRCSGGGDDFRSRSARGTNFTELPSVSDNEIGLGAAELADVREDSAYSWDAESAQTTKARGDGDTSSLENSSGGDLVVAQSGAVAGVPGGRVGCGAENAGELVPLELELVVGSRDLLTADTLVRGEHQPEMVKSAGVSEGGLVCMHELLVVALVLAWLLVQLLLLVGCCIIVKRYRNFAEMASQKDYQSFDNVGFDTLSTHRRVHWPDQNVDILHIN